VIPANPCPRGCPLSMKQPESRFIRPSNALETAEFVHVVERSRQRLLASQQRSRRPISVAHIRWSAERLIMGRLQQNPAADHRSRLVDARIPFHATRRRTPAPTGPPTASSWSSSSGGGWSVQFLEQDCRLPRKINFKDAEKIWEIARRG